MVGRAAVKVVGQVVGRWAARTVAVGRAAVKVVGKVVGSWAVMMAATMAATMAVEVGPFHTGSTWGHEHGRRNPGGSMWS